MRPNSPILALLAASTMTACGDATPVQLAAAANAAIRIGAFNFTESVAIAEIYAQALEAVGLPVARIGRVVPER